MKIYNGDLKITKYNVKKYGNLIIVKGDLELSKGVNFNPLYLKMVDGYVILCRKSVLIAPRLYKIKGQIMKNPKSNNPIPFQLRFALFILEGLENLIVKSKDIIKRKKVFSPIYHWHDKFIADNLKDWDYDVYHSPTTKTKFLYLIKKILRFITEI